MNQSGYILESVRALALADTSLAPLVPGGFGAYDLRSSPATRPFGQIEVNPIGEPEFTSGKIYAQSYECRIQVWSDEEVGDAAAIQDALNGLLPANTKLANLVNNAWTLHISLEPDLIIQSGERLYGKFVFIAGARWEIQLQEQRV